MDIYLIYMYIYKLFYLFIGLLIKDNKYMEKGQIKLYKYEICFANYIINLKIAVLSQGTDKYAHLCERISNLLLELDLVNELLLVHFYFISLNSFILIIQYLIYFVLFPRMSNVLKPRFCSQGSIMIFLTLCCTLNVKIYLE